LYLIIDDNHRCLISFHPATAVSRSSCVNLQADLCGVTVYAFAQALMALPQLKTARFQSENLVIAIQCFRMTTY